MQHWERILQQYNLIPGVAVAATEDLNVAEDVIPGVREEIRYKIIYFVNIMITFIQIVFKYA